MIVYYSDNYTISETQNGFTFSFFKDKTDVAPAVDYGFGVGMSPLSAKEFLYALYNAIGEHENKHGEIKFDPTLLRKLIKNVSNPIGFKMETPPKV